ncbi:GntR family transcriptional regulator / MocR family aminotransferase [Micromonospora pattaloongensis]|uniref:GntR family transcriptional regulator / MocR family aminotransferase n=1 Tax=Micromonospora pattaloongensis TaxID=405436 RepID=A0A1H3MBI3_9ACTN|nr:PLP-dependent aminotransferase family protein [Micromonospora pattaloongensis]SDY74082.1 GntR family transcriptional regulator / MocR family aminotransferase [Micromonospora pattaloongensis]
MSVLEALVALDRTRPLAAQLTAELREAIATGRLAPGTRLPSSRDLAADLRVSRGVVVEAYEQLVAEGRVVARRGAGTTVAGVPEIPVIRGDSTRHADDTPELVPDHRDRRVLRPGVPDLSRFPRGWWVRAYERAVRGVRDDELGYGDPAGAPRLRGELAGYLGRVRGARIAPDHLVVTTGAAQAFGLLAAALRADGHDAVGVEEPGSVGVRDELHGHGLRTVPLPVDADGLDPAALDRAGLPAVLVTPAHQFPTGVVLSPARRSALLAWARRTGGLIVEDDYDAEFRYDRDPVGCLQGLAPEHVAYVGSASKGLAPGLRLGWLAVPPRLRAAVLAGKEIADLGGPVLEQLAFAELLAAGGYDRHLRRVRRVYRARRDALVDQLRRHLPAARVSGVAAGLHLVVELPDGVDDEALARAAYAVGLGPLPLRRLRIVPGGPPGLVLGYAAHTPDELSRAVRALAALVP